MTTPWLHTPDSSRVSRTPYAGPTPAADATESRALPAQRPYVPVALRSRPHSAETEGTYDTDTPTQTATVDHGSAPAASNAVAPDDSMPWISEFLASSDLDAPHADAAHPATTDSVMVAAVTATVATDHAATNNTVIDGAVTDIAATEHAATDGAASDAAATYFAPAEPERAEDWPFADAGAQASELSVELPSPDPFGDALVTGATPAALPMWNDDDMMDIMPVRSASLDEEDRAATAAAEQQEHSEAAARALEGLAVRVRGGELTLPGYASEMGDAAALAAALAALLGVRH